MPTTFRSFNSSFISSKDLLKFVGRDLSSVNPCYAETKVEYFINYLQPSSPVLRHLKDVREARGSIVL